MMTARERRDPSVFFSRYDLPVKTHQYVRRFLLLICLAAIFLTALSPITLGVLFAFLIPVWFFFAAVISVLVGKVEDDSARPLFGFIPVFSPRPPPLH